jgi:RNA recognition motif-containing protein
MSDHVFTRNFTDKLVDSGFSGPPREELPVPTVPPFTAFVGNLTFETDDEAVKEHLGPGITSVRLVKDPMSGKPKGYGYVEYGSQGELKVALGKNMTSLGGRTIRVSVAEPRTSLPLFRLYFGADE